MSDEILYAWKRIARRQGVIRDHVYVEPAGRPKLLLGSVAFATTRPEATVFRLPNGQALQFVVRDTEILLLRLTITDLSGDTVVKVVDNYVTHVPSPNVVYRSVPGRIEVTTDDAAAFLPPWVLEQARIRDPSFALNRPLTLLSIAVDSPGVARVQGVWAELDRAVVVDEHALSVLRPDLTQPLSIVGDGVNSVLLYSGALDIFAL